MRDQLLRLVGLLMALMIPAGGLASSETKLPIHDGIGGEFSAESSLGRRASLSEFRGKVVLLFFGYTSCQDICPVTLAHLKSLVNRLGPAADGVQVLFVTVDPENDTAQHLAEYLARFDSRFIGFTGKREETDRIAELFMVHYHRSHGVEVTTEYHRSKTFTEQSYLYSHSQQIYLLDKSGRTRALFFSGSPLEEMQTAVTELLQEPASESPAEKVMKHDHHVAGCRSGGVPCPDGPAGGETPRTNAGEGR